MRALADLSQSRIFQRITDASLKLTVETAAKASADLLGTVVADMPLFTLHNERHILNVIGWMETLLEEEGIAKLSQIECAMAILAAYTHDLGMTLSAEERERLPDEPAYKRHIDRFPEECRLIERLRAEKEYGRASLIESYLRMDYLRATHADAPAVRLRKRIGEVASRFDYRAELEILSVSHNHPAEWLRHEFDKKGLPWETAVAPGERVNYPFIGLLLRLGDILDFDATRAPSLLFQHIGLDRELTSRFQEISAVEWRKHMAITTPERSADGKRIVWHANRCPHPAIEKSIRQFIEVIRRELQQAAAEYRHAVDAIAEDRDRLRLPFPEVDCKVTPARGPGGTPCYNYHDWSFRLDQDEILRLLMGESLYGDPSLCIRELLQNALDAVELRDLRLQLKERGGRPEQPVDGVSTRPGWFKCDGPEQQLEVVLTWGEENGQQYITVTDNGTGMTLETIERYFTRIGKSFYKSPDFLAEQSELRRHGLLATPISTFGIGVLSCFMIADRLEVRTHPGHGRTAHDLQISGPGSLFWTKPGTRESEGTEVKLWLRQEHRIELEHDQEKCFRLLRQQFGYEKKDKEQSTKSTDLGFVAASHVVWPKYPVRVSPPGKPDWVLDDRFHDRVLAPLDAAKFSAKLEEWEYTDPGISDPVWNVWDWTDDKGEGATGTRFRIWFPEPVNPADHILRSWERETFVDPQMGEDRAVLTVHGMHVPEVSGIQSAMPCAPGPGRRVWVDLRGGACPRLTADRKQALIPSAGDTWNDTVAAVWQRLIQSSPDLDHLKPQTWREILRPNLRARLAAGRKSVSSLGDLLREERRRRTASAALLLSYAGDHALARDRAPARERALARDRAGDRALARERARDLTRALASGRDLDLAFVFIVARALGRLVEMNLLQEAFFPDLSSSWPPLGLQALQGRIGDAILVAPFEFRFELHNEEVLFADQAGTLPAELSRYGYDLCFPMTAIPLGSLRRDFPAWREDRSYRPLGVLPFLVPGMAEVWIKHVAHLTRLFHPIRQIYALDPPERLWFTPYSEWTEAEWARREHRSLLWDIPSGAVFTAQGIHHRDRMPRDRRYKAKTQ